MFGASFNDAMSVFSDGTDLSTSMVDVERGETVVAMQLTIDKVTLEISDYTAEAQDVEYSVMWKLGPNRGTSTVRRTAQYVDRTPWRSCDLSGRIQFRESFRMLRAPLSTSGLAEPNASGLARCLQIALVRKSRIMEEAPVTIAHAKQSIVYERDGKYNTVVVLQPSHNVHLPPSSAQVHITVRIRENKNGRAKFRDEAAPVRVTQPRAWALNGANGSNSDVSSSRPGSVNLSSTTHSNPIPVVQQQKQQAQVEVADNHEDERRKRHAARSPQPTPTTTDPILAMYGVEVPHEGEERPEPVIHRPTKNTAKVMAPIKKPPQPVSRCCFCGVTFNPAMPSGCRGHYEAPDIHWPSLGRNMCVGLGAGAALGAGVGLAMSAKAAMIIAPSVGGGLGTAGGTVASFVTECGAIVRHPCCGGVKGTPCMSKHDHSTTTEFEWDEYTDDDGDYGEEDEEGEEEFGGEWLDVTLNKKVL
eukprot:PhM_4_TR14889/c1_g1_i1/m.107137